MNETTENFWEVWSNFNWPEPKPVFYRAYVREDGTVFFSMEDLPGNFVEIDLETYRQGEINTKVVNGKVVKITPATHVSRLYPSTESGTPCCPTNVSIVVDNKDPHILWKLKIYDNN
jgi:hypothetical protein